jgi:uncharacterized protein YciI
MNWYLVIRRGTDPTEDPERLARHLDWMREQHEHGTVFISGPSSDLTMGLFVVRAHSRDEATSVATDDPLYQADKTTIDVIEWHVHQVLGIGPFDIASLRGTSPDAI